MSTTIFFLISDQAQAIWDKRQAGGVALVGAVAGGAQAEGGVIVAAPPHFPPDDLDEDEGDTDNSKTDSDASFVFSVPALNMFWTKMFWI